MGIPILKNSTLISVGDIINFEGTAEPTTSTTSTTTLTTTTALITTTCHPIDCCRQCVLADGGLGVIVQSCGLVGYDEYENHYCNTVVTTGYCYYTETSGYGTYGADPERCTDCIDMYYPYPKIYENSLVTCCCSYLVPSCPDDL